MRCASCTALTTTLVPANTLSIMCRDEPLACFRNRTFSGSAPSSTGSTCPSGSAPGGDDDRMRPTAPTALSRAPAASSGRNMLCSAASSGITCCAAFSGLASTSSPAQKAAFWRLMSSCKHKGAARWRQECLLRDVLAAVECQTCARMGLRAKGSAASKPVPTFHACYFAYQSRLHNDSIHRGHAACT